MSTDTLSPDAPRRQTHWSHTMNTSLRSALAAAAMLFAQGAWSHDPAEHAREAAAAKAGPDCASMKRMDLSEMDPNDPVTKALHERCRGHGKPDGAKPSSTEHGGH
ncbi:hypothetical protein C3942_11710 [Solimonas fluminis]|uniref:Uncharacterized protein n=2 Tax=Solimonas fluminis TaxID=2086571 RepID=A0A2S5TEQ4_9GAMM|nr:hypothetical protein C3942_11710 [Solimonas fluminis]